MEAAYAGLLRRMQARGWAPPRARVKTNKAALVWLLVKQSLLG